jgi:GT2 family glycosyltransferase
LDLEKQHRDAIAAFQQDRLAEAIQGLEELLVGHETAELWNDWGVVQLSAREVAKAESGFRRALHLAPHLHDAAVNLAVLLVNKGELSEAKSLLDPILPSLPLQQREHLQALMAQPAHNSSVPATSHATRSSRWPLHILIITDMFPSFKNSGPGLFLIQLMRAIREQGHTITLIVREGTNGDHYQQHLQRLNVRCFVDDRERLACLGISGTDSAPWTLATVLGEISANAVFLVQSFARGISVPEQYLDDIRRLAPEVPVAILCTGLYCNRTAPPVDDETRLQTFEAVEDWSQREWEALQRADLVMTSSQTDAVLIRNNRRSLHTALIALSSGRSEEVSTGHLAKALALIPTLAPKPRFPELFSALLIEKMFADRIAREPGEKRVLVQVESYARIAGNLLHEGKAELAREQLRHIFGRTNGTVQANQFHAQVFTMLSRCYRELGNPEMAERCAAEARACTLREVAALPPEAPRGARAPHQPLISAIVPTYNRLPILQKCLAALAAQTLPAQEFEVIVVDDGSTDGTEAMLRGYSVPFRLQYLRQKNSGTGAARRNGVAQATGEYLLLMNDDTICDRDALQQHLRVQQSYPNERWAVLGNFEYPAAARERALTHYFRVEPFMFPQVGMEEICPYGYSHFITCNLSVRRDAVLAAGSFDPTYKLSEDTELGLRLFERGYRVLYHPLAHAWHDHLPYPAKNLIRRARIYGADYFHMFRRHPRVFKDWAMPIHLTAMDEENAARILGYVEHNRLDIEDAVAALERWDAVDFEPVLTDQPETATMVLGLFRQAVPAIHWFYLFETMLDTMVRELGLAHLADLRTSLHRLPASASGG